MHERFANLYLIGLTGNIGCGKSTVGSMLAARGADVLDADQVTRIVMQPGQPAYARIVESFGPGVLETPGGPIDRPALGRSVFGDTAQLRRLESIVHPATREYILGWLRERDREAASAGRKQVVVVDAIRLIEAGYPAICDAVWVVACDGDDQLKRLVEQRGMSAADARQRIAAQPPQAEKLAHADVVINNTGDLDATEAEIEQAWEKIRSTKAREDTRS